MESAPARLDADRGAAAPLARAAARLFTLVAGAAPLLSRVQRASYRPARAPRPLVAEDGARRQAGRHRECGSGRDRGGEEQASREDNVGAAAWGVGKRLGLRRPSEQAEVSVFSSFFV